LYKTISKGIQCNFRVDDFQVVFFHKQVRSMFYESEMFSKLKLYIFK